MKKQYIFPILGILVLGLLGAVILSANVVPVEGTKTSQGIQYSATVCTYVTRADGTFEDNGCSHNILTGAGENMTRAGLFRNATVAVTNISLCNNSDALILAGIGTTPGVCGGPTYAGDETFTRYDLCGLGGLASTYTDYGTEGNWTISNTFTSTCDYSATNVTRLGNGTDTFASNAFATVTLQTDDQLTVNWTIGIS